NAAAIAPRSGILHRQRFSSWHFRTCRKTTTPENPRRRSTTRSAPAPRTFAFGSAPGAFIASAWSMKRTPLRIAPFVSVLALLLVVGCAATGLRPGAERVMVTHSPAPSECKFVGTLVG